MRVVTRRSLWEVSGLEAKREEGLTGVWLGPDKVQVFPRRYESLAQASHARLLMMVLPAVLAIDSWHNAAMLELSKVEMLEPLGPANIELKSMPPVLSTETPTESF